jgi:hypothetical protein
MYTFERVADAGATLALADRTEEPTATRRL